MNIHTWIDLVWDCGFTTHCNALCVMVIVESHSGPLPHEVVVVLTYVIMTSNMETILRSRINRLWASPIEKSPHCALCTKQNNIIKEKTKLRVTNGLVRWRQMFDVHYRYILWRLTKKEKKRIFVVCGLFMVTSIHNNAATYYSSWKKNLNYIYRHTNIIITTSKTNNETKEVRVNPHSLTTPTLTHTLHEIH